MTTTTAQTAIQIDWKDRGRSVVVSPEDEDRFLMTCQEAADARRQGQRALQWRAEFDRLLKHVHAWSCDHKSSIRECFVAVVEGQLMIFVVPKSTRLDFGLNAELADLDVAVAKQFPLCRCEVLQIPGHTRESLATFLDANKAIQIYGDKR